MMRRIFCQTLADLAVEALVTEAQLTPKPGLVDAKSNGAHGDMTLGLMVLSAQALRATFYAIADYAYGQPINQALREGIAMIGREGETQMLTATGGINTHKGAIWSLGLLVCALATQALRLPLLVQATRSVRILTLSGEIARFVDRNYQPSQLTKGAILRQQYPIISALDEARLAFPAIRNYGLPHYYHCKLRGDGDQQAYLNTLISLMSVVDDTCVLSRGDWQALEKLRAMATTIVALGGVDATEGAKHYQQLCELCVVKKISPGGSADLLSAIILLIHLEESPILWNS